MQQDFTRDRFYLRGTERAAVVRGDIETGVAGVDGAKEAAEVFPDRFRIVGIVMGKRALEGIGGQQAAVFAKGAEQDAVQQLLGAAENFLRSDRGVLATQPGQHLLPDIRVEGVKLVGQFAPDGLGSLEQFIKRAVAFFRNNALRTQEEHEAFEQRRIGS